MNDYEQAAHETAVHKWRRGVDDVRATSRVPARLRWAVEQLGVRGTDRILEIGGGRGVAASLICPRLTSGCYLGIDRSASAVRASVERNREQVDCGVARFEHRALEEVDPATMTTFDRVLAVNVNLFWTRPAQRELTLIRTLLSDGGRLQLCYDGPHPDQVSRIVARLSDRLDRAGFTSTPVVAGLEGATVAAMHCRPR